MTAKNLKNDRNWNPENHRTRLPVGAGHIFVVSSSELVAFSVLSSDQLPTTPSQLQSQAQTDITDMWVCQTFRSK